MKLNEHIQQLPTHSLESDMWSNIENQLSGSTHISERLPHHKAKAELWLGIAEALDAKKQKSFRLLQPWTVAASVAVMLTASLFFHNYQSKTHIYYTEEVVMEQVSINAWEIQDINVMENCNEQPAVCTSPNFTRLKSSLDQLKMEEQKLREMQESSDDPNLEIYHSRLVKDIQQVEAQILQLFS